jgi:hypothetical protein
MPLRLAAILLGSLIAAGTPASAHHSYAMFDGDNMINVEGIVTEFKLTSPHAFILIKIIGPDGSGTGWSLEGSSASSLVRDGWSSKSLKPGDEVKIKVAPLRSGAPGGAWNAKDISFRDGKPIVTGH